MDGDVQVGGPVASIVFQRHFTGLVDSLMQHTTDVASKCHSEFWLNTNELTDVLSNGISEHQKIVQILSKVETRIKLDYHNFTTFLKIVTEVLQLDTLSQRMEDDFKKLKEQAEVSLEVPPWYYLQDTNPHSHQHDRHQPSAFQRFNTLTNQLLYGDTPYGNPVSCFGEYNRTYPFPPMNSFGDSRLVQLHNCRCHETYQASRKSSNDRKEDKKSAALNPNQKSQSLPETERNTVAIQHQSQSVPNEAFCQEKELLLVKLTSKDELAVKNGISKVNNWFDLGEQLEMEFSDLQAIKTDEAVYGLGHQRSKMVHSWLSSDLNASWNKLCRALDKIGEKAVAESIRTEYIYPMANETESTPSRKDKSEKATHQQEEGVKPDQEKATLYDIPSAVSRTSTGDSSESSAIVPLTSTPRDSATEQKPHFVSQTSSSSGYSTGTLSNKSSLDHSSSGYSSQTSNYAPDEITESLKCTLTTGRNHNCASSTISSSSSNNDVILAMAEVATGGGGEHAVRSELTGKQSKPLQKQPEFDEDSGPCIPSAKPSSERRLGVVAYGQGLSMHCANPVGPKQPNTASVVSPLKREKSPSPPKSDVLRSSSDAPEFSQTQPTIDEHSLQSFKGQNLSSLPENEPHSASLGKEISAVSETSTPSSALVVSPSNNRGIFLWPSEQNKLQQLREAMDHLLCGYEADVKKDEKQKANELEAKASELKSFYEEKMRKIEDQHRLEVERFRTLVAQKDSELEDQRHFHNLEMKQEKATHDREIQYHKKRREDDKLDLAETFLQTGKIMRNQRYELAEAQSIIGEKDEEIARLRAELAQRSSNGATNQPGRILEECDCPVTPHISALLHDSQRRVRVCNDIRRLCKQLSSQGNLSEIKNKILKLVSDLPELEA